MEQWTGSSESLKKIKIAFAMPSFLIGGIQSHFLEQLNYFNYQRYDIYLITLFDYPNKQDFFDKLPPQIKVKKFHLNASFLKKIPELIRLMRYLGRERLDIVVSSMYSANKLFRVLSIIYRYKIITRENNYYSDKTKFQLWLDRVLAGLSYKIVAVSETVKQKTIEQSGIEPAKFTVIHNGVNLRDIFQYQTVKKKTDFGLNETDVVFVCVARINKFKNHKLLIDSFIEVCKIKDNYKLLIIGDGNIDHLPKHPNVIFLGGLPKDQVYEYLSISDFYISTSLREGLSNAYLEALAFGLPLLSTKTPGTDELLIDGYNGFYIQDFSQEAVIDAIKKIGGINYSVMSQNCQDSVKKFDMPENVRKYQELFEACIRA